MASTSIFRPSSRSSTPSMAAPKRYDVFLSFRGEDTRYTFTNYLYEALVKKGIRTFRDDKLKRGEAVAPELLKTIEESRTSIVVFSENYANSRWCLDELVKIMECREDVGHTVIPIFYHMDPSHVRKQAGHFGEAFADYEENWKDKVKVGRWRTALTQAGNLSGWHIQDGYESNHIKKIIDCIFHRLDCQMFYIGTNLVGIDSHLKELDLWLHMESNDIRIIGIYGLGGIGKTTIAKAIYNRLSWEFENKSFLENISEVFHTKGLSHLQNQLIGDILREKGSQNIKSDGHGASMIKTILSCKRVLIVLDVDDQNQLEYLIGIREWLGKGSRVIVTTRDKHLLTLQGVDDLYEVPGLNFEDAYKLFSLYAFKQNCPKLGFIDLSCRAISYCKGLPLALKVMGSSLFGKTIPEWESELRKLEREPEVKIHKVLKRSYDGLDHTTKNIFLDVACFFKGGDRELVSRIMDGCDFYAARGIKNLNDKCLITLPNNQICMHALIQQMGWEIVREKFPNKPNKWSRLWDPRDIERALRAYKGIDGVETISLDLSKLKEVHFNSNVFTKMAKLRLLKVHSSAARNLDNEGFEEGDYHVTIANASKMKLGQDFEFPPYELRYLRWDGYPFEFLPSNFDGENLIELHLKCSNIKQLWQGNKYLEKLKVVDVSHSWKIIQMSEFSSMPTLEKLILKGCVSLIDIHPSIGVLKKLTTLDLRRCDKLKGLPSSISNLESLEILNLSHCSSFDKFPEIQGNMRSLKELYLYMTAIRELPNGIDLESVLILDLRFCVKFEKFPENGANMKSLKNLYLHGNALKELPSGIANWESLPILDLSGCAEFERFPENVGNMKSLQELQLKNTAIKALADSIEDLESLEILDLSDCSKFEKFPDKVGNMKSLKKLYLKNTAVKDLPDSIGDLESLEILDLSYCSKFEKFPEKVGNMRSLNQLLLMNTLIKDLPDSIGDLEYLEVLDLSNCSKFEKFPEKVGNMKSLKELRLENTAIKDLPDSIGGLEYLKVLDLSYCSKLEKFPENVGTMRSLQRLSLKNTAITYLPDSIGDLESLRTLDLSDCSKFEKFPEKARNLKFLWQLFLMNTAIKDLPDCIGDLEYLWTLNLSDCSKFEKFPEIKRSVKHLWSLNLKRTAIEELPSSIDNLCGLSILDLGECKNLKCLPENISKLKFLRKLILDGCSGLWEGSILNLLNNLGKINTNHYKMAGQILQLPSSLEEIHAHGCRSKKDVWSLLWYCHLNWLRSASQGIICRPFSVFIPDCSGIPEWIRYDNLGNEVTSVLPRNWYKNPDFLGFVVSCVYKPRAIYLDCELKIHVNGFEFKDSCKFNCLCKPHGDFNDQVRVWWYPRTAISEHCNASSTHLIASFRKDVKKCGVNLVFVGDVDSHMPMLVDHLLGNSQ